MRVFVYEFVTGGGWWSVASEPPSGSLLAEGAAMAAAVSEDFARLPGTEVSALLDIRLSGRFCLSCQQHVVASAVEERLRFAELVAASDWTLVIAPEFGGHLLARSHWVQQAGGLLLSPGPEVIELTADKQRTAEYLAARGIAVPQGRLVGPAQVVSASLFPAVLKPVDGCGSLGVCKLNTPAEFAAQPLAGPMRLESYIPGMAASVAVLCGPDQMLALPACAQHLAADGSFSYLGGRVPLGEGLDQRARRLALEVARALPHPRGYLGVDLVLGDHPNGSGDYAIEVNPRLTTSYVGLRTLCRENLARAMVDIVSGKPVALSWRKQAVKFSSDGHVRAHAAQVEQPVQ